jgi:hypothetical protein
MASDKRITKDQIAQQVEEEFKAEQPKGSLKDRQMQALTSVAKGIWDTSTKFDIDSTAKNSPFDRLVSENVLQKQLETDNLIYVEGSREEHQPAFISRAEFDKEVEKQENWDVISAGDYQAEFDEMFDELDNRTKPKLGYFERKPYFDKIFPGLKIQKPGYDLYGSSTILLSLTALYVFMCYQHITVDMSIFKFFAGQSSIFGGEMSMVILFIITVIILERYTNRTDTKADEQANKRFSQSKDLEGGDSGFFSQEEMFARTSTQRSMTVKLKTMKTSDLDMQGGAAQDFL